MKKSNKFNSKIIWFSGLSGAGKTTLTKSIYQIFSKTKQKCLIIDGDIFRKKTNQKSFSHESIVQNNLRIINHCKNIQHKYDIIFVSVISPLKKTRYFAYKLFKKSYFEIFVFCSLKNLIERDTKGLYKLAKNGKIKNLIGFNSKIKYEKSTHKHLRINTGLTKKSDCIKKILDFIN